jgi:hypothetical protein
MSADQSLSDALSQIELVTGAQLAYSFLKSAKTWGLCKIYGKDLFSILIFFFFLQSCRCINSKPRIAFVLVRRVLVTIIHLQDHSIQVSLFDLLYYLLDHAVGT